MKTSTRKSHSDLTDFTGLMITYILPTYHEDQLSSTLQRLQAYLEESSLGDYEILVVDDSPSPYFKALSQELLNRGDDRIRLIQGPRHGKGAAVRQGILESKGDIVFFMDADLPVDLKQIEVFAQLIRSDTFEAVIAQRIRNFKSSTGLRTFLSYGLFTLQWLLVFQRLRFRDTQCGFKAVRGTLARKLARLQRVEGGMFDIELLYAAVVNHVRIGSVWVEPQPELRASKIRIAKCLIDDPLALLILKLRGLRGHYRLRDCAALPQLDEPNGHK